MGVAQRLRLVLFVSRRHGSKQVPWPVGARVSLRCTAGIGVATLAAPLRVGQRQQGKRSHRRRADRQLERPDSRRPRSAVADPYQPVGLLPEAARRSDRPPSSSASTKRSFVATGTRQQPVLCQRRQCRQPQRRRCVQTSRRQQPFPAQGMRHPQNSCDVSTATWPP